MLGLALTPRMNTTHRLRQEAASVSGDLCKVCDNATDNRAHLASERMFGMGGAFRYLECGSCGCLQLLDVPDDLERYYSREYYAFDAPPVHARRQLLRALRTLIALRLGPGRAGLLYRRRVAPYWLTLLAGNAGLQSRILDVGSGSGGLLTELQHQGFRRLLGVDPYIEHDLEYTSEFRVLKRSLDEIEGSFDFILLNHSFEHVEDPQRVLDQAKRLLTSDGTILVRTPLADSVAWKRYGCDWVQLDAPRHLFVHTRKSLEILAAKARLRVVRVLYDSTAFQFWGSEQYRMGIALESERSHLRNPANSPFSLAVLDEFAHEAERLNAAGLGDQAAFWLAVESDPTP
jgi:SAM-dependent methyltransferase